MTLGEVMNQIIEKRISEILNENFKISDLFYDSGIDFNQFHNKKFRDVCSSQNIQINNLLLKIDRVNQFVFREKSLLHEFTLKKLIDYILDEYHTFFYKNSVIVENSLAFTASKLSDTNPFLLSLYDEFISLKEELITHMAEEEEVLFPRMKQVVLRKTANVVMKEIEHDHNTMITKLINIRKLTNNYVPPENIKIELNKTYKLLRSLDKNLHQHIYLENIVLFKSFRVNLSMNIE